MGRVATTRADREGWHHVVRNQSRDARYRRNKERRDFKGTLWKWNEDEIVSFYFSEIPDTHSAADIFKIFALYGKIVDVVIPGKVNKWGRRFGFARFSNVKDPRMFAVRLDSIIIGAKKIYVNLPWYQRSSTELQKQQNVKHRGNELYATVGGTRGEITREKREGNVSKKWNETKKWNVAKRWSRAKPEARQHRRVKEAEFSFNVAEEELEKLNKMYVGVVKVPGSTHMVQEHLSMQGIFSIKITPLGANKVLMEEVDEGIILALIADAEDLIYGLFEDIRK